MLEVLFGGVGKFAQNGKKVKTEKFKLLSNFIENLDRMELNLNRFKTKYVQVYLTVENDVEKLDIENKLKSDISEMNKGVETIIKQISARNHINLNSDFGKDLYKILNQLIDIYKKKEISRMINLLENEKFIIREIDTLKKNFVNIRLKLLNLKEFPLSYFENENLDSKMMSSELNHKKV